jgi:SagB-type dehydrogenase family enzyme
MKRLLVLLFAFSSLASLLAQPIELPAPQKTGGMPLMEALSKRATSRKFDPRELSPQQLANLLWAGFGVSRPDGRRTAPSASNAQENEIYVLLRQGAYVYDAAQHRLQPVIAEDLRPLARSEAPVALLYVADLAKRTSGSIESKKSVACIDSGFISENVYLFCASEGLATGYRGGFDRALLAAKLNLRPTQEIIAVQPVGYPQS